MASVWRVLVGGLVLAAGIATVDPAAAQQGGRRDPTVTGALPSGDRFAVRRQSARDFALDYLAAWSSNNPVALDSIDHFYGSSVAYHGRRLSAGALADVKRRFARTWPDRDYRHRPESVRVSCDAGSSLCTVRSVFDYVAAGRGRRARGSEWFELGISFASGRPVIVQERSGKLRG